MAVSNVYLPNWVSIYYGVCCVQNSHFILIIRENYIMNKHFLDMLSVGVIILFACIWLVRTFIKIRQNKCVTVCSGCSGGSCSTKSFVGKKQNNSTNIKLIKQIRVIQPSYIILLCPHTSTKVGIFEVYSLPATIVLSAISTHFQ